ncbi:methionyl-tRNA formyltransferase [Chromatiales bacterium (ex Bugula neritina AB1)]|nr:methionyl-tRNA formyltransferase [Chromatiales bacterium (ex Bugula neritina AB1)]
MNKKPLRIIYAGTPEFAVPALRALASGSHQMVAVYTQPDRPAGRGRKLAFSPVKEAAVELGIDVEQPVSLKQAEAQQRLAELRPDLIVVAAYGLIFPQDVLDLPPLGCINIHASLLPRWRGAAPIQRAIAAGDEESGITIMQMAAGLDTGDMLLKISCDIADNTTGSQLHDKLAALGADALLHVMHQIDTNTLRPEVQDETRVTYAHKLSKQEASIDWHLPARTIHRNVCAFNSWPVAQTLYNGETLRVWQSTVLIDAKTPANKRPGEVLCTREGLDVVTGDGVLRLLRVQVPGKKPVASSDFIRGRALEAGQQLG